MLDNFIYLRCFIYLLIYSFICDIFIQASLVNPYLEIVKELSFQEQVLMASSSKARTNFHDTRKFKNDFTGRLQILRQVFGESIYDIP